MAVPTKLITAVIFFLMVHATGHGGTITTSEIITQSHSPNCLDWKISGICIWLKCSIFGCYVTTTPRISHRLPDLVVIAYPRPFQSPWEEFPLSESLNDTTLTAGLSGGDITGVGSDWQQQDSLRFNEVDVIGNPGVHILKFGRFLCKSAARPMEAYFLSVEDADAWRGVSADSVRAESLTPGLREIGRWPHFTWGSVFPRSGFVFQAHPAKAAAVTSQRAVDIVLRDGSGHHHRPLARKRQYRVSRGDPDAKTKTACSLSGGAWKFNPKIDNVGKCVKQTWRQWIAKSDESKDRWQMLIPQANQHCETFGQKPHFPSANTAQDGEYAWNHWTKYKCCVDTGGVLLKAFDF